MAEVLLQRFSKTLSLDIFFLLRSIGGVESILHPELRGPFGAEGWVNSYTPKARPPAEGDVPWSLAAEGAELRPRVPVFSSAKSPHRDLTIKVNVVLATLRVWIVRYVVLVVQAISFTPTAI